VTVEKRPSIVLAAGQILAVPAVFARQFGQWQVCWRPQSVAF